MRQNLSNSRQIQQEDGRQENETNIIVMWCDLRDISIQKHNPCSIKMKKVAYSS